MDPSAAQAVLNRVIDVLQNVRRRPEMYFNPTTPEAVENWLFGLQLGIGIAGVEWSHDALKSACARRGIGFHAMTNLIDELSRQGKSSDEVAMASVEIAEEMWQGRLAEIA